MAIEKVDLVAIRDAVAGDRNFVLATWLRGLYYGDTWYQDIPKDIFMKCYHMVLERILSNPGVSVKVACLKDQPDVILGYAVSRTLNGVVILDWLFVKTAWRHIGIGKSLVPENLSVVTHLTKVGRALKPSTCAFNPFLI